jgi:hypothetical protein
MSAISRVLLSALAHQCSPAFGKRDGIDQRVMTHLRVAAPHAILAVGKRRVRRQRSGIDDGCIEG